MTKGDNYKRYKMTKQSENVMPKSRGKMPISNFAVFNLVKTAHSKVKLFESAVLKTEDSQIAEGNKVVPKRFDFFERPNDYDAKEQTHNFQNQLLYNRGYKNLKLP